MSSYIKAFRSLLDWEWWSDINTTRVFMYFLLKANWKDGRFQGQEIKRGSFVSSVAKIAVETNLTEKEVRTAIKHLKSTGEVASKATNKYTVFTVNNYNQYQDEGKQEDSQGANEGQTKGEQRATIEEVKKERIEEYNNITPLPPKGEPLEALLPDYPMSDVMADKVRDWLAYKKQKKDKYTEQGLKALLNKITKQVQIYGDIAVCDCIDLAMSNGWKGIVWEKLARAPDVRMNNDKNTRNDAKAEFEAEYDRMLAELYG